MATAHRRRCCRLSHFRCRIWYPFVLRALSGAHDGSAGQDWSRETFGLAMALQNLLWGLGLPVAGILADRWGSNRVIIGGAMAYFAEVYSMAVSVYHAL